MYARSVSAAWAFGQRRYSDTATEGKGSIPRALVAPRFDIRNIPKKPPAPSLNRRRRTKVVDALRIINKRDFLKQ
jgi:hypothetical protein